jgi:benzylsuccinate CoA-transferase BbsF subunit
MLADHGADVIKIESRAKPDGIRLSPPFAGGRAGINRSGYFADRNTSKRSCAINLKTPQGREVARRLIARSDVVANSFTPGVMDRFGLGWEDARTLNPAVVYLSMSMQGMTGPDRDFLGYGMTISALVGLHGMTAEPGRVPVGTGTNYPDHIPNPTHAAFAVLAALRHARRTGRGQIIDMAQTEATIAMLGVPMLEYSVNGRDQQPVGNRHARYAPHGVYRCDGDDRWVAIAVASDAQFQALLDVLGLAGDRWRGMDESGRRRHAGPLDEYISTATRTRGHIDLALALQRAGVPAAPVHDARGVVQDPQLRNRRHWIRLNHAEMGSTLYNAPPFRMSGTPVELTMQAPMLGEHTVEVCRDVLQMPQDEIDRLISDGVLA